MAIVTAQYQVAFEGNRLDLVAGVNLYNYDFTELPNRDIKIYKLARRSKSIITSSEFTQKNIPVYMDVCSGGRQETEGTVTYLKSLVQAQNGTMTVLEGGDEVQYIATLNEFNIVWNGNNAYCSLTFLASDPIGFLTTPETLFSIIGITTAYASATFNVDGSATAEARIDVTLSSVTGGTGKEVTIYNARTNQGITIAGNFNSGDIISIDSRELTITVNGVNKDFTGLFPTFSPGVQQVAYTDSFTARTVDITATNNTRLL